MRDYTYLITGMGRSGTSFLAQSLKRNGVYIGKDFYPDMGAKGGYENKEFEKRKRWADNWQKKQRESQLKYSKKKRMAKKKKKRKYKKKPSRTRLKEDIDELWSLKVRENCKCELCGKKGNIKSFDAHHIKKRGHMSTRWYIPNGACLCKGCHIFKIHMDTITVGVLIEKLKKERDKNWWDKLVERKKKKVKLYIQDLRDIKELVEQDNWEKVNKIIEKNYV